jgi:L-cystine transport system substrate-binding protein
MFAKGNTELQQAVDGALKQLKESGKLAQISIAVIGGDYTESE